MRLLVSVRDAAEAVEALRGGADVVDAKEPSAGPLGAVDRETFRAIVAAVAGARPVSAALGDARRIDTVARDAAEYRALGAAFVKIGFAGVRDDQLDALVETARAAAGPDAVVAAAYADHHRVGAPCPAAVLAVAARHGIAGILLDTADKRAAGLCAIAPAPALAAWVARAHAAQLTAALAGRLSTADLVTLTASGADLAGVRGAACAAGRDSRIDAARVRALREAYTGARLDGV